MGQTREQIYTQQLKDLGIWEDAFTPMVKELAQIDRRRTRLQKAWAASAPPGGKPSFLDPHYALIVQAERDALAYREAMGLTPKSLRRLRGQPVAVVGGETPESLSAKLDRMLEREDPNTAWSFEEMLQAVPTVGTDPAAAAFDSLWQHDEAGQPVNGLPGSAFPEGCPEVKNNAE